MGRFSAVLAVVCLFWALALSAQIPAPPSGLAATPVLTTRIDVSWTAVAGAKSYQIDRRGVGTAFTQIGTPNTNSFQDHDAFPGLPYLYRVRAVNNSGTSANSEPVVATTVAVDDASAATGQLVLASHLAQARACVDAVRSLAGEGPATVTDPAVPTSPIRAVQVTELRSALDEARLALSLSNLSYAHPDLTAAPIRVQDFRELWTGTGSAQVPGPRSIALSPSAVTTAPLGPVTYTVTLDTPAIEQATISMSVSPANAGTLPATVLIPASQPSAMFTYTDGGTAAFATVTATFGAASSSSNVMIQAPGASLIINEIDYDQVNIDTAEFIELYNPTSGAIDLTNLAVVLVNGANNSEYARFALASAGSLPAGAYLVIGGASIIVPPGVSKLTPAGWASSSNIQNGSPDGIAIVNTDTSTVLDALSYAGSITMAQITGFPGTVSLVEGTALPSSVIDSNTAPASLCRIPNGVDTNDAASDWVVCSNPSAGSTNQQ